MAVGRIKLRERFAVLRAQVAAVLRLPGWASSPEQEQGVLRISISIVFLSYLLFQWPEPGHDHALWQDGIRIVTGFLFYSLILFIATLAWPGQSRFHRILGICVDIGVFSYGLHITGLLSAPWYGVYLWVTLGNGFRYGEKYLYLSGAASLIGFGTVVLTTPYWQSNQELAVGLAVTLLVIPAYSALLIRRLNEARQRADFASRAKSDFLSRMSHEIRTPLNGILGMTDLLRTRPLDPEDRQYVETIHASGKTLAHQIDDILDLSKIEADRLTLEMLEFDLYALINTTLRIFDPQVRAKQLRLQEAINPATPFLLYGDPHKLRQIIINLVGNAVKFTGQGIVSLRVYPREQDTEWVKLRFEVADTGKGIPADRLQAIFEPFSQADSSVARHHGGTGLGTTICRRLVELMGGDIGVQSDPNTGTTFWFDLPFNVCQPRMTPAEQSWVDDCRILCLSGIPESESDVVASLREWGIPFRMAATLKEVRSMIDEGRAGAGGYDGLVVDAMPWSSELGSLVARLAGGSSATLLPVILTAVDGYPGELCERSSDSVFVLPSATDRRVLFNTLHACYTKHSTEDDVIHIASQQLRQELVSNRQLNVLVGDDNATNRLVLERMLVKMGYQCTSVSGGLEVLTALETERYDVVIVDKNMPDMGGLDVFTACCMAHSGNLPAKFIILTADATAESRDACRAAGIEYFLTKPVSMAQLQEMLARAMADVETSPAVVAAESNSTPAQEPASLAVVDEEAFARLEILAGDNRYFMRDIVDNFEKDARRDIRCLETAVASHDWREFMDCAHALKGRPSIWGSVGWLRCARMRRISLGRTSIATALSGCRKSVRPALLLCGHCTTNCPLHCKAGMGRSDELATQLVMPAFDIHHRNTLALGLSA